MAYQKTLPKGTKEGIIYHKKKGDYSNRAIAKILTAEGNACTETTVRNYWKLYLAENKIEEQDKLYAKKTEYALAVTVDTPRKKTADKSPAYMMALEGRPTSEIARRMNLTNEELYNTYSVDLRNGYDDCNYVLFQSVKKAAMDGDVRAYEHVKKHLMEEKSTIKTKEEQEFTLKFVDAVATKDEEIKDNTDV